MAVNKIINMIPIQAQQSRFLLFIYIVMQEEENHDKLMNNINTAN